MFNLWKWSVALTFVQGVIVVTGFLFDSVWTGATIAVLVPSVFIAILMASKAGNPPASLDSVLADAFVGSTAAFLLAAIWTLAAHWAFVVAFAIFVLVLGTSIWVDASEVVRHEQANGNYPVPYAPWMTSTVLPLGISLVVGGPFLLWHRFVSRKAVAAKHF